MNSKTETVGGVPRVFIYLFIYLFWTLSAVHGFLAYIMLGDGVGFHLCIVLQIKSSS